MGFENDILPEIEVNLNERKRKTLFEIKTRNFYRNYVWFLIKRYKYLLVDLTSEEDTTETCNY